MATTLDTIGIGVATGGVLLVFRWILKLIDGQAELRGRMSVMAAVLEEDRRAAVRAAAAGQKIERPPWLRNVEGKVKKKP